jgi:hypothetical protein
LLMSDIAAEAPADTVADAAADEPAVGRSPAALASRQLGRRGRPPARRRVPGLTLATRVSDFVGAAGRGGV